MSTDYLIALHGKLPTVVELRERLAAIGPVGGTWKGGVNISGIALMREGAKQRAKLVATLTKRRKKVPAITDVVRVVSAGTGTLDPIASAVAHDAGGLLFHEDASLAPLAIKPKGRPLTKPPACDVSIPADARKRLTQVPWFTSGRIYDYSHVLYRLAPRRDTTLQWGVLAAALPGGADGVHFARDGRTLHDKLAVGRLVVDSGAVKYFAWHVTQADAKDWNRVLALMCGAARATGGVLYRDADPTSFVDFAPTEPPPKVLSQPMQAARFTKRAREDADLVTTGSHVRLRWRRGAERGEGEIVVGGKGTHPALGVLNGTRVGDVLTVDVMNHAKTERLQPPAPSLVPSSFDLQVLIKTNPREP